MSGSSFDGAALRLSAVLLLAGQLLHVGVTLLHPGGDANHHAEIFAVYAASTLWTAVHLGQFAAMAILLAGLIILPFSLPAPAGPAGWAGRLGAAAAVVTLCLYGVLQAVDGIALKQAVTAWAGAPEAERMARLASAEAIRWLEWGVRSCQTITLGLALLLCAAAMARAGRMPRPLVGLMGLSGLAHVAQGWIVATEGFSHGGTIAIVAALVLNLAWMIWLLAHASWMPATRAA